MTLRITLALSVLGCFVTGTASAEIGAMDPVPSATLLFPYFEADTSTSAASTDTLIAIENAAGTAQRAHVVVWSDRGVPVLDFDLYLAANGRERMSMRAILTGDLPKSMAGQGVAGCTFPLAKLSSVAVKDLVAALTGKPMPSVANVNLGCPGADHGDQIARGYVTVDTVTGCSAGLVTAGTYWSTKLSTNNTLLGSFTMLHGKDAPVYAEQAVHIEASSSDSRTDGDGDITFYGRLVAYKGSDHRERLPTMWSAEYLNGRSDVLVWRETKRNVTDPAAVGCKTTDRQALDLGAGALHYFDDAENLTDHSAGGTSNPFTYAAGRYAVGGASGLPTPYRQGFMMANLNFGDASDAAGFEGVAQSVALTVRSHDVLGTPTHATLAYATPLDNGFDAQVVGVSPATAEYDRNSGNAAAYTRPRAMIDNRSAASLLLPYFEVSLDDPNAAQTRFTIRTDTATARLAKVTLFTDRGVPTLSFMVYLTGYDRATIDLRLLLTGGLGATTGSAGQDSNEQLSAHGPVSQDINFASCTGNLPRPVLSAKQLAFLRAAHTGKPADDWGGKCGGRALGDEIARGYIMIDDHSACTTGPVSDVDIANTTLGSSDTYSGSFEVINRKDGFAYAAPLVALHDVHELLAAGDMTFYGWLNGWPVNGYRREPLPNVWRVPFVNDSTLGTSELVFFRPVFRTPDPYACDAVPGVFSKGVDAFNAFDNQENSSSLAGFKPGFVAGRVPIGSGGVAVPYTEGALELNLNFSGDDNTLPSNAAAHMGYVGVVQHLAGITDPVFVQGFPLHLGGTP